MHILGTSSDMQKDGWLCDNASIESTFISLSILVNAGCLLNIIKLRNTILNVYSQSMGAVALKCGP